MEINEPETLDPVDREIAKIIRGLQAEQNLQNLDLIAATGIKSRTMIRILKGKRPVTIGELRLFALALGTTVTEIVDDALGRVEKLIG